jgi:polygalacturonase
MKCLAGLALGLCFAAATNPWPLETFVVPPNGPGQSMPIESFGGSTTIANNVVAIASAMNACDKAGGCTLVFHGPGTYHTSAFNLTSNLRLQIDAGAVLQGTQDNKNNCAPNKRPDGSIGNCTSSNNWPVLPWPSYPSTPSGTPGGGAAPAMHAWIRSYNQSNIEITGGGVLDAGGPWWWCTRFYTALATCVPPCASKAKLEHAVKNVWGCADAVKAGTVPILPYVAPRMLHLIESNNIHMHNITIQHSPYWTMVGRL